MGQQFSSGNNVYVYTDRPFYHSGDAVNGFVMLNCVKPFQCDSVTLKIEGEEKVSWEEKKNESTYDSAREEWVSTEEYRPYSGDHEFFKVKQVIHGFSQMCQVGQYQFPFSFVLPTGLPGSFHFDESHTTYAGTYYNYTKANITYSVKAECEVKGILASNIKHKCDLSVYQRLTKPPSEIKASHHQTVSACCCAGQGTATVNAWIQKDSYSPGEIANLLLEVHNDSNAEFASTEVKLKRSVTLTAGGAVQVLEQDVAKATFPGIHAQAHFAGDDIRSLPLQLPAAMLPSTFGKMIECEYHMVIKLKASAFVSDVTLKVPVLVHIPPAEYVQYQAAPEWWHATMVAPPCTLALPSAPPLPPKGQTMDAGYTAPQPVYEGPSPAPQPAAATQYPTV